MTGSENNKQEGWLKKAEEALQRATDAVSEAWKASENTRHDAWQTAKRAAEQASDALDKGIEAAKTTWETAAGTESPAPPAPDAEPTDDNEQDQPDAT